MNKVPLSYKTSGVDIDQAEAFVRSIRPYAAKTLSKAVLRRKGAFGALFDLSREGSGQGVLVSSTDGVGTKLLVAKQLEKHDTVGIDLVAMNVNDILCVGARPLFFLDYIACGRLNPATLRQVVKGIAKGCRQAGCSLVGGETAEMPGMYQKDDYDLAGFAVGVVDKKRLIDGSSIRPGDVVVGLPSSGLHSNGYSLVRKVFAAEEMRALKTQILRPTRIYVEAVLPVLNKVVVRGMAHITGGAFYEKLTKILPEGLCFAIDKRAWRPPRIFRLIQEKGGVEDAEMYRTFNMGIGFVLVVAPRDVAAVIKILDRHQMKGLVIGEVVKNTKKRIVL